jgi:hypothetical protein
MLFGFEDSGASRAIRQRLCRPGQHTVTREKRNQRRHRRIARAAHRAEVAGALILVVNGSAVHRTGKTVRSSHRAARRGGTRMTARLPRSDRLQMRGGARIERDKGRERRRLKDDPASRQKPQVPSKRGHGPPFQLSGGAATTQPRVRRNGSAFVRQERRSTAALERSTAHPRS